MNRIRLRNRAAQTSIRLAKRVGVQIEFKQPSDPSWTTLWGFVTDGDRNLGLRGGETDTAGLTVIIPRQGTFPPANWEPGCQIRYPITSGTVFQVDSIDDDNEDVHQASTWTLKCGRFGYCTVEIDET